MYEYMFFYRSNNSMFRHHVRVHAYIPCTSTTTGSFVLMPQSMFNASLKERQQGFRLAPGTSLFIHWLVGMVYVFYFASFVLLLREVLRPGVLWFLRNLNDPDFNPIHEMIHLPVHRHARRVISAVVRSRVVMSLQLNTHKSSI